MATWFTSDWHFGHERIIEYCKRPFAGPAEMREEILRRLCEAVRPGDTAWVLGDALMGDLARELELLERHRPAGVELVLLAGNHDRPSPAYWANARGTDEKKAARRARFEREYLRAFDRVETGRQVGLTLPGGTEVLLAHFPYSGDSQKEDRYPGFRPSDAGLPLVCGHVHTDWAEQGRQFNVGVDVRDFRPVPASAVEEWARGLPAI